MASFVLSHNNGDTFDVGTTTVTITATDIHGNVSTASFDVTITDDEAPTIAAAGRHFTDQRSGQLRRGCT